MQDLTITATYAQGRMTKQFNRDNKGRWTAGKGCWDEGDAYLEADVISDVEQADNWQTIRAEFFPMHGFHA